MKSKISILLAVFALMLAALACGAPAGVSNIYMANDKEGTNKTTSFAPTDTVYVFFDVSQIDAGTQFQIKWYALNVDGQDPNEPIATTDYDYNNESTILAHINSTGADGLPTGDYKVEIYMSDKKVGEQLFTVQ